MDVYLQPHSDDICFSLGGFAYRRRSGIVLTVCPISSYVPLAPGQAAPPAHVVTEIRKEEDRAFCRAADLEAQFLEIPCGSYLGYGPFDLTNVSENAQRIGPPMIAALHSLAAQRAVDVRPWLFCPGGIGGHVDHVAIRMAIIRDYDELRLKYRVAFYEDLHYASDANTRHLGVQRLLEALEHRTVHRNVFPLGRCTEKKLALISLYPSQFLKLPDSIAQFTPATEPRSAPHEAIWSEEVPGPNLPNGWRFAFTEMFCRPSVPLLFGVPALETENDSF